MSFFEYMLGQASGLGGGMMCCFTSGMIMVIPLALVLMPLGEKAGTFVGEGLVSIFRRIFRF